MSPHPGAQEANPNCFPRVSGDEPGEERPRSRVSKFSPRERG